MTKITNTEKNRRKDKTTKKKWRQDKENEHKDMTETKLTKKIKYNPINIQND